MDYFSEMMSLVESLPIKLPVSKLSGISKCYQLFENIKVISNCSFTGIKLIPFSLIFDRLHISIWCKLSFHLSSSFLLDSYLVLSFALVIGSRSK